MIIPVNKHNKLIDNEIEFIDHILMESKTELSKITVINVVIACRTIYKAKGAINYAKIANFISDFDNDDLFTKNNKGYPPPKYQSILNNKRLKSVIDFYSMNNSTIKKIDEKPKKSIDQYPTENLDSKTKIFIRMQTMKIESLENEKKNLSAMLAESTKKAPIDLHLSHQTAKEKRAGSLQLTTDININNNLLMDIINKLFEAPNAMPEFFILVSRGEKSILKVASSSSKRTLFNNAEWSLITEIAKNNRS
ncbi:TPA: hypothetical protein ACX6RC_000604 [Photobacterium damselae]|uniref:hypothetical protein n=1 Tax=Photobacterium damselae TaxID=38293 RepID=UPI003C6DDDC1